MRGEFRRIKTGDLESIQRRRAAFQQGASAVSSANCESSKTVTGEAAKITKQPKNISSRALPAVWERIPRI